MERTVRVIHLWYRLSHVGGLRNCSGSGASVPVYTSSHKCVHLHMAVCPFLVYVAMCVWEDYWGLYTIVSSEGVDGSQNSSSLCISELPPPLSVHHLITNTQVYTFTQLCIRTAANTHTKSTHMHPALLPTHIVSLTQTHTLTTTLLSVGTADKLLSWFLILFRVTAQESWNNTRNLKVGGGREEERLKNEVWRE